MDNPSCGNPECTNAGKLKCGGCSSVAYCSSACQKKHWPSHKTSCKASAAAKEVTKAPVSPAPTASLSGPAEINARLQEVKAETQKAFTTGDFPLSITKGLEAMALARQLPAPASSGELIQLHLNLASAYMHTQNKVEAENQSNLAVAEAEKGCVQRPGPQATEVLTIALGSRAFTFLNIGIKLDEAYESAAKSLALAETIYPKNDPRLHKSLRAVALVRDKQGDFADAEKHLLRAYTIIALAAGAHAREAQMILDDLLGMFMRRGDFVGAEKHASKNYMSLKDKTEPAELIVLADAGTRLAAVLRKLNRDPEAEQLITQALQIREQHVNLIGPKGVAFTLIQLAQVMEAQGKYGDELEAKLMRALEIFGRTSGQQSPEVMNTLNSLRNVRQRRKERELAASGGAAAAAAASSSRVEELDEDGVVVTSESKAGGTSNRNNSSSSSSGNNGMSPVPPSPYGPAAAAAASSSGNKGSLPSSSSSGRLSAAAASSAGASAMSDDDLIASKKFEDNDAIGRMMLANKFFETSKFSYAEKLIAEAYAIFLRQNGPDHSSTQAARQNLTVVRNSGLNQLWMQVVTEELLKMDDSNPTQATEDGKENASASSGNADVDEYARLMSQSSKGSGRAEDQWLSSTPQKNDCILC